MPYKSKAKPKTTNKTKVMKPVDTKSYGETQFKIVETKKKKLKKKDIFETDKN